MKNLVAAIYSHPEAFPPTLNALDELSGCFADIAVVHLPVLESNWNYPSNVTRFARGATMSALQQLQASLPSKIFYFMRFTWLLLRVIRRYKPQVILAYDNISLYSYHLLRPFIRHRHYVWYHNHDVVEPASQRKYSIGWLALRNERKAFAYLSLFTLPTDDRLPYFDLSGFKGKYVCVPNFPSLKSYRAFTTTSRLPPVVSLIFQGSMDNTHGIEELLPVLRQQIAGKGLMLKLLGKSMPGYQESILAGAESCGVRSHVQFEGLQPYRYIPQISAQCHIGIAIYTKQDVMNTTISTASNKIYEYAAVGLPVLSFDNEYYRNRLGRYPWIFFTDCTQASYTSALERIISRYEEVSAAARQDFTNHLNFEAVFEPVKAYLSALP